MSTEGKALLNLADIANCLSGDFHTMHLNFKGAEFDTMHKEVLKEYYEQAAEDYDSWSEAAAMFDEHSESTNDSAKRIEWKSFNESSCDRDKAIQRTKDILETYADALATVFKSLNKKDTCYKCIGVANTLQTRIEYWSKEVAYFNTRRF